MAAAAEQVPGARVAEIRPLPGGVSSLTYAARLERPGEPATGIVIKVAPPGLAAVRNRDVLRQARAIDRVHARGVLPVPAVLFVDPGSAEVDDDEPPLFAMELASGQAYEPALDVTADPPTGPVARARMLTAARALARWHADADADPGWADGLGAEPALAPADEVERWATLMATVPEELVPHHAELLDALRAAPPAPLAARLVHGDYRLSNMLFVGTGLTAVIDWEIWSIGDPRTDLVWLALHTDPAHRFHTRRPAADEAAAAGLPSFDEVIDAYRAVRPVDLPDLDWFVAGRHYMTAATLGVIAKRNRRLDRPSPQVVAAAESLPGVIRRGLELIG